MCPNHSAIGIMWLWQIVHDSWKFCRKNETDDLAAYLLLTYFLITKAVQNMQIKALKMHPKTATKLPKNAKSGHSWWTKLIKVAFLFSSFSKNSTVMEQKTWENTSTLQHFSYFKEVFNLTKFGTLRITTKQEHPTLLFYWIFNKVKNSCKLGF